MGKRGNENAQLSKEEYDALEARGSSRLSNDAFSKASEETLQKRRIVKSNRYENSLFLIHIIVLLKPFMISSFVEPQKMAVHETNRVLSQCWKQQPI